MLGSLCSAACCPGLSRHRLHSLAAAQLGRHCPSGVRAEAAAQGWQGEPGTLCPLLFSKLLRLRGGEITALGEAVEAR